MLQLPIAETSNEKFKILTVLVDKLLNAGQKDIEIENEINQIVYDLYSLTEVEKNIIESSSFITEELKKSKLRSKKPKQQKLEI